MGAVNASSHVITTPSVALALRLAFACALDVPLVDVLINSTRECFTDGGGSVNTSDLQLVEYYAPTDVVNEGTAGPDACALALSPGPHVGGSGGNSSSSGVLVELIVVVTPGPQPSPGASSAAIQLYVEAAAITATLAVDIAELNNGTGPLITGFAAVAAALANVTGQDVSAVQAAGTEATPPVLQAVPPPSPLPSPTGAASSSSNSTSGGSSELTTSQVVGITLGTFSTLLVVGCSLVGIALARRRAKRKGEKEVAAAAGASSSSSGSSGVAGAHDADAAGVAATRPPSAATTPAAASSAEATAASASRTAAADALVSRAALQRTQTRRRDVGAEAAAVSPGDGGGAYGV